MKNLLTVLATSAVLIAFHILPNEKIDFIWSKFTVLSFIGSLALGWIVSRRYGYITGAALAYTCLSGFSVLWMKYHPLYASAPFLFRIQTKVLTGMSLSTILVVAIPALYLPKQVIRTALMTLPVLGLFNSFVVLLERWMDWDVMGLGGNPSMNAAVIAMCIPLWAMYRFTWLETAILWIPNIVAIVLSKSSIPMGLLAAELMIYGLFSFANRIKSPMAISATPIKVSLVMLSMAVIVTGFVIEGHRFMDSHGRLAIWAFMWDHFREQINAWYGAGIATYGIWIPHIQKAENFIDGSFWLFLHNDWLQILMETGIIGISLYSALFTRCVYSAWDRRFVLIPLILWGMNGMVNWNLHHGSTCLIGALLLRAGLDKEVDIVRLS